MKIRELLLITGLLTIGIVANAKANTQNSPTPTLPAVETEEKAAKDPLICRRELVTGSNRKQKICITQSQLDATRLQRETDRIELQRRMRQQQDAAIGRL